MMMCKMLNIVLMAIPLAFAWMHYYSDKAMIHYYTRGNIFFVLLFICLYWYFGRVYEAFLISFHQVAEMIYSQVLSLIVADGIMYAIFVIVSKVLVSILPMAAVLILQCVIAAIWCIVSNHWYYKMVPPYKTIVVYDVREGLERLVEEYGLDKKYEVLGTYQASECIENLSILDGCEYVFLSGVHSHDRNILLKYCVENNIQTFIIPRVGDVIMSGARKMHLFHLPMLKVGRYNPSPMYILSKRLFDLVVGCAAFVVASPFMLITAIAIKSYDKGPVFYKQKRLTKDGKEFYVLKFRSMRTDAEKDGVARLSSGDKDPRITPVGRVIRACRMDELPQLFNILKGDMSIVGPRPERPEIAAQYCEEMPEFNLRLQAKAGLTGFAQVYGKYNTTPYDKLQMDLMYIANPSFLEDLKICFATVKILFLPESTEGVAEGQTTAMGKK